MSITNQRAVRVPVRGDVIVDCHGDKFVVLESDGDRGLIWYGDDINDSRYTNSPLYHRDSSQNRHFLHEDGSIMGGLGDGPFEDPTDELFAAADDYFTHHDVEAYERRRERLRKAIQTLRELRL